MSIASMCESKANTYRLPINRDDYGGTLQGIVQTLSPRLKNIPCSYQESGGSPKQIYGQRNTVVTPTVYFMIDPHVDVNDVIVVTNMRTKEVAYLNVEGETQPIARGRVWQVTVQRIRQPAA